MLSHQTNTGPFARGSFQSFPHPLQINLTKPCHHSPQFAAIPSTDSCTIPHPLPGETNSANSVAHSPPSPSPLSGHLSSGQPSTYSPTLVCWPSYSASHPGPSPPRRPYCWVSSPPASSSSATMPATRHLHRRPASTNFWAASCSSPLSPRTSVGNSATTSSTTALPTYAGRTSSGPRSTAPPSLSAPTYSARSIALIVIHSAWLFIT